MKNLARMIGIIAFIAVIGFSMAACDNGTSSGGGDGSYTVKYEITGPAVTASTVSYYNESGAQSNVPNVSIPWTKTITVKGEQITVACGAITEHSGNTYVAKIFVNGKEVKNATNTGTVAVTYVIQ